MGDARRTLYVVRRTLLKVDGLNDRYGCMAEVGMRRGEDLY